VAGSLFCKLQLLLLKQALHACLALLPAQRGRSPAYRPQGLSAVLTYNVIGIEYLKIVFPQAHLQMAEAIDEQAVRRRVLRLITLPTAPSEP